MPQTFVLPRQLAISSSNQLLSGALLYFYQTNTTTAQAVHSDKDNSVELTQPVPADASGQWPKIYLNPNAAADYRVKITTAAGVLLYQEDDISRFRVSSEEIGAVLSDDPNSAEVIGSGLYRRTAGEIAAVKTPVNYAYSPGWVTRFATNTTPGTTDMAGAWQDAIDSADLTYPVVRFTHRTGISKPLLIRSTSVENLSFVGEARTISIIDPIAIDIHQAAQGINALIINQCDNGHLHLRHLRALSTVAYTGYFMYAIEGGALDGLAQAAYSMVVDDCWFSLSSQNAGIFRGGFSNLKALNCVYESVKDACWILEGAGNGDLQFIGHQMFICFDNFIRASDANDKALVSVIGLHAYNHQRGRLLEFNKGKGLLFDDIILEPDAANLGDCGLFKLTDCDNVLATNFSMKLRTGVPAGAVGIDIINGCTGKFANGVINATTGLKFSGAGVLDLIFQNVDFTGSDICWSITGTQTGKVRFINCKMNDAQQRCISDAAATAAFDVEFIGGEIKNAGLGGTVGFRNVLITSAGNWTFRDTIIGQDNVSAAAGYYVDASGSGTVKFFKPTVLGTPPTALKTGAQGVYFEFERGVGTTIVAAASIDPGYFGDVFFVSGATGIGSIQAGNNAGRRITLIFQSTPTVTDGSNLKMNGNLVATADDTLTMTCDGTNWFEICRSVN